MIEFDLRLDSESERKLPDLTKAEITSVRVAGGMARIKVSVGVAKNGRTCNARFQNDVVVALKSRADAAFAETGFARALNQRMLLIGAVGVAARHGNCAQKVEPGMIGILAGPLRFNHDPKLFDTEGARVPLLSTDLRLLHGRTPLRT